MLRVVLPDVEHRRSRYLNNGIERDHGPGTLRVKQRLYPVRGCKQGRAADTLARGQALIQNVRPAAPTSPLRSRVRCAS